VDLWALGVITYTLLSGYLPFEEEDGWEKMDRVLKANYHFDNMGWRQTSYAAMVSNSEKVSC
jgi:calcium/calmodulin-dependent protein kinase I